LDRGLLKCAAAPTIVGSITTIFNLTLLSGNIFHEVWKSALVRKDGELVVILMITAPLQDFLVYLKF
jgi:hypothetical protein